MKKIKPLTWFILVVLIAAAGYVFLGMTYIRQQREQKDLAFQVEQLRPAAGASDNQDDLRRRLTVAQEQLAKEQASFPSRLRNTEVVDWIQQTAQQSQVTAFVLQAKPLSSEKVGERIYNVLRVEVTAEGSFPQLKAFVQQLEEGTFKTLVLDRADTALDAGKGSISLSLSVYAHPAVPGAAGSDLR
ncbi:MAG: hypothetical protein HYX85_02595 [Chloroflexi bacterium]|nr:hypothetical protein [Chloroflexota bacterium]